MDKPTRSSRWARRWRTSVFVLCALVFTLCVVGYSVSWRYWFSVQCFLYKEEVGDDLRFYHFDAAIFNGTFRLEPAHLTNFSVTGWPTTSFRGNGFRAEANWRPGFFFQWPPLRLSDGSLTMPLYLPAVLAALGVYRYFPRRTIRPNQCPCGYELAGNTSGLCPECGKRTLAQSPTSEPQHNDVS